MRRLAIACFSFSAAVFISNYILPMGILPYVSAVFFLLGIYFVVRPAKFLRAVRISVFALAVGFALFYIHNENTAVVAEKLAGQSMDISAKLISCPVSYDDYCRAEVRFCTQGIPKFKAIIYDNSKTIADAKPGDILSFYGRLSSAGIRYGEEYDNYYAKDIYLIVNTKTEAYVSPRKLDFTSIPQKLNHLMAEHIESIFPHDTSAFVKSLLLGDKTDLYNMPGQYNNLSRAGLSHVVAVN